MENLKIFDAHCDTLCRLCDDGGSVAENTYNADTKRMQQYRAYTQVFACFIAPEYYDAPMSRFNALYKTYLAQDFSGITPILSLEGGEVISSLEDVEYLHSCGVRCIALTWNNANKLASGVLDCDTGLTPFGKSVVRKMEELGIIVDVSHLSDKSFYDIARIATKPIIATHSNSRAVCAHPRNLTDDMFNIIKDSGGCVGINMYPIFLTENRRCTSSDAQKHIEHFMSLGGGDAIGIGADFDGTDNRLPEDIAGVEGLGNLFELLTRSGMEIEYIDKISHANFCRVFGEEM